MHLITRHKACLTYCSLHIAFLINHNSGWGSMEIAINIRLSVVEKAKPDVPFHHRMST